MKLENVLKELQSIQTDLFIRKELIAKRLLFPNRPVIEDVCGSFPRGYTHVRFRYGYTKRTMLREIESITFGYGKPEWGAPKKDEQVFIIKLKIE